MNDSLAPIISLLAVAFITPGPNNFIVMGAATRGGFRQTIPIMIGIVLGTVALYLLASASLAQLMVYHRKIGYILLLAGVCYLAILGLQTIIQQANPAPARRITPDPSLLGIALFQVMNPKSVILIATVAAATADSTELLHLVAGVMAIIAAACLTLWAMAGSALSDWLAPPDRRRAFEVVMGLLLIASAIMLYGWGEMR